MNHSGSGQRPGGIRAHVGAGDVVLEGVNELVAQHVVGGLERARHRQDDAALIGFGDAAGAFADFPFDRVGLTEVGAARVEDQRLPPPELVREKP